MPRPTAPRPSEPGAAERRPGAGPLLLALLVVALGGLAAAAHHRRARAATTPPPPPAVLDPAEIALDAVAAVDPRWAAELGATLAGVPPFAADDRAALDALQAAVEGLSFVAAAGPARVRRSGEAYELDLPLRLREPVACARVGGRFLPVAADGTVLSGDWPSPPRVGSLWLPVVATDDDPAVAGARPGDWLALPRHRDALDVATSLAEHLPPLVLARLGRVVVEGPDREPMHPDEPGVRLLLEDGRVVLFGRPPSTREPGELPAATKWEHLRRALALDGVAWEVLDARWDAPELRCPPQPEPEAAERADDAVADARPLALPPRLAERPGAAPAARERGGAPERPRVR